MDKKEIIKEFVEFVEGKISFDEFEKKYETNPDYNKILDDKKPGEKFRCFSGMTVNEHMKLYKWSTTSGKLVVHRSVMFFLQYYNIPNNPTNIYQDEAQFKVDIQPSYVNIEDENFLNEIIEKSPKNMSKTKQKIWIKERIKEMFKFDSKPPRWIQDPEWPIVDGKPLVFKGQTKEQKNDERVYYTFYDPEDGKETTIMQFY